MSIRNSQRFVIPDGKELSLNQNLVRRLNKLQSEGQENIWRTFLYAAGLRAQYQVNDKWDKRFTAWYKENNLHMRFGTMSQFSKCASAGEVIHRFSEMFSGDDEVIESLPVSMNALYEVSLLIKGKSSKEIAKWVYSGGDEFDEESGEELGIISPVATAERIRQFRLSRVESKSKKQSPSPTARKREFTVPIATIYASKSLYEFSKTGEHSGTVDLAQVKEQIAFLKGLDGSQFDIRDRLEDIEKKYERKMERSNPVKRVYAKKRPTRKKKK